MNSKNMLKYKQLHYTTYSFKPLKLHQQRLNGIFTSVCQFTVITGTR